ncbi:MAG: acyl-CoA dehydrogenase family protein, partial [Pseudomonadota bacterium]
NMRMIAAAGAGEAPGLEASMLKVKGSLIRQELNDLSRRAIGPYAMPFASEGVEGSNTPLPDPFDVGAVAGEYFNHRKISIFGGSNEVQKNIIAKVSLGARA